VIFLLLAIGLVFPSAAAAARERPLEQAKEEQGELETPPSRFGLGDAALRVTPNELLAASPGQKLRFSVETTRPVPGATLAVTLPRRWLERPASGLPATRPASLRQRAGGRARLGRAGRTVELDLASSPDGTTASFEVEDRGIPAGTYRLPFSWRDRRGRVKRDGTATVRIFARVREGEEKPPAFGRLASPGVTTNVSGDTVEESETFIATTPGNRNRIAVGVNWSAASMPAWVTDDAGQSWTQLTMPQTIDAPAKASSESGNVCCDPMFAADSAGNIWYGGLTLSKGSAPSRIVVNRVAAGSRAFRTVTTGLPTRTAGTQDKPMMTVDESPSSPTRGRLYVVWDEPASGGVKIVLSQCDTRVGGVLDAARCDNADNWSTPASVTPTGSYIYPDVAVGPDGRAYVTWWDYSNANAIQGDVCDPSSQSCAGATGWGTPQTVALLDKTGNLPVPFACSILAQPGGRAAPSPQVDVDHSGGTQNGRVYVTWGDLRAGSGTTRCAENPTTGDGTPPLATHLTWDGFVGSAAGGALPGGAAASSSVGTRLLTDGEGGGQSNSDDWFPWLAVDQTNGQAWADLYSTRDDAGRRTTNFYARSVTPGSGGHALGTLTKVSSAASDYSSEPCCQFGNDYGDYTGLDATQGIAYPVWSDNSAGDGEVATYVPPAAPQPPAVTTDPASTPGQTSATVNGAVDPNGQATTYHFEYGTDTTYGSSTPNASAGSGTSPVQVSSTLTNLTAGTTYHYRLVATNVSGTRAGADRTFTTASPPPNSPTAVTGSATEIEQQSARLNATVNPNGSATSFHFEYGTASGALTSQTAVQSAGAGSQDVAVSTPVSGLSPGTTYFFRVVAEHSGQTPVAGSEQSFKTAAETPAPTPQAPVAVTGGASSVGQSSATVSGTVDANGEATTYRFDYGTSTAYGLSTPVSSAGSGSSPEAHSAALSLLQADTLYHYRIRATSAGGSSIGTDRTFRTATVFTAPLTAPTPTPTPVAPAPDTTPPRLAVSRRRVGVNRRRLLRVRVRCASTDGDRCVGRLRLTVNHRWVGSARFSIAPASTGSVRVRLSRSARRRLVRRGRLVVRAGARARDEADNLGTASRRVTLVPR